MHGPRTRSVDDDRVATPLRGKRAGRYAARRSSFEARSRCVPILAVALGYSAIVVAIMEADVRSSVGAWPWGWPRILLVVGFAVSAVWVGVTLTLRTIRPASYRGHREVYRVDRETFFRWTRRLILKLHIGILGAALLGALLGGGILLELFRTATAVSIVQLRSWGLDWATFGVLYLGMLWLLLRKLL